MKRWNIKKEYTPDSDMIRMLLENRGVTTPVDVANFLNPPKISDWINKLPVEFKSSLKKAKQLINEQIAQGNPIIVHGDYDADGVCATAILYQTLKKELAYDNAHYFIPNRFKHGYGLSKKSLHDLSERFQSALLITVDSGITAVDEVAEAQKLGFKVIITDHHQEPVVLPNADCIVWSDEVVGSTLSWILSRVLGSQDPYSIAFASLATITDLQPVLGFNRSILKIGLEIINNAPPLGLKKMFEVAGRNNGRITGYDLGWVVGPRLNASGRLVEAEDSLKLLIETDENKALEMAIKLNTVNVTRQDKTLEMFELAKGFDDTNLPKIIFSANVDYHEGIIGLVAAKLAQKYYRPAVVVSIADGFGKGSVRSVPGVNIIEILREVEPLFESLGGHPMAAGFSLKVDRIPELEKMLVELAIKHIKDEHLVRSLNIDMKIPAELVGIDFYNKIITLEPFGLGNEEPIFSSDTLTISSADRVGRDAQHLSLKLYKDGRMYKAIWFGAGEKASDFKTGDLVEAAYSLSLNTFNGKTNIDLLIKDIRKG